MRSALICVFFTLLTKEGHVAGDDFRPTPIPLNEWRPDESRGRAGTLHETIGTPPPAAIAIPAHYWEDALRHSVYLTLIRDKIDQLIAKGDFIAADNKYNTHAPKEVDDQDLWEKIKSAPFDRIKEAEPTKYGDVMILARGRLMEEPGGYRFAEDEKSHNKCDDDKCQDGVKAFWSVKRVRQRDQEISQGRYHYELTFSVMSQIPRKEKPFEHPIRTFTVQESSNNRVTVPRVYNKPEIPAPQISRPERAIWFHKNIPQTPHYRKRQHHSELDRLFSSLFDYDDEKPSYETPRIYKQSHYQPSLFQNSKIGHVGSSEQNGQIKALPYPYKLHNIKYHSQPFTTSSMGIIYQHSLEQESGGITNPYISQADYVPAGFNNIHKTMHPAVLPTPLPPLTPSSKESPIKKSNATRYDMFENVTNPLESGTYHKQYNKAKTPAKASYFPEHLRPPIYNAPPGVFVTMDKKPFKPMPPLKMPATKPLRTYKPIDFRPSPQVLDVQFSEPDPLFDTAFRPMTVNYDATINSTEKPLILENNEKYDNKIRKPAFTVKKPQKKKEHKTTTNTPDIITAHNKPENDDVMEWADLLGIFAKTTPMESQKEKEIAVETTTPLSIATVTATLGTKETTSETPATTTATPKMKKRTRPPTKFNKPDKIKKHKRVTTTTTTTTTSTTTNTPVTDKITEVKIKKISPDTKQASTTRESTTKLPWKPSTKKTFTTPSNTIGTSATTNPTSTKITTTIATTTTTAVENKTTPSLSRSKNANRFRQSTLMLKGTSLKHDRWSVTSSAPEKLREASIPSSFNTHRRKGSNFHGYISSTPKNTDEERNSHDHIDHGNSIESSTSAKMDLITKDDKIITTTTPVYEETVDEDISMDVVNDDKNKEAYEESRDHKEYIFQNISDTSDNKGNEIIDTEDVWTTEKIITTTPKIKKCKKKHQNLTIKDDKKLSTVNVSSTTNIRRTTAAPTTSSMLEDLLNDFSFDDSETSQTTTTKMDVIQEDDDPHEEQLDDDLKELLDSIKEENKYEQLSHDEYDNDEDEDDDDNEKNPMYEDEDINYHSSEDSFSHFNDDREENRPVTLLELLAME
ncbi:uncharacterized protein [Battus philenor]|uniref:uncharacterized protein n=1 Tax=Battus philenor TaxID=42288 RepID=UPI0035D11D92